MDTVRIILRFHSLFYTPHFVAMHLGVFEQEKLRVEVRTANSGGELASALLKGEANYLEQGQPAVERLVYTGRGSVVAS